MSLDGTNVVEDLPRLLEFGEAPERLLAPFLHESVHHWCNVSPVGSALSLLQLRLHRTALQYTDCQDPDLVHELVEAQGRYDAALAVLDPLAEGMAMFAEFDLTTRQESRVWSQPMELAALFFQRPMLDGQDERSVTFWAAGAMQRLRLGTDTLDRKIGILGRPLTFQNDVYLSGYLIIRQLWLAAVARFPLLAVETDLFLMYLRSYFYDDFGLAAVILDDSLDEIRGAERIVNHVLHRLKILPDLDPEHVIGFEAFVARRDRQSQAPIPPGLLAVTEADHAAGQELLDAAARQLNAFGDIGIRQLQQQIMLKREFLYVGSWPAHIEVKADGRYELLAGKTVVREGMTNGVVTPGRGEAVVDVLQWIPQHERLCAVYRGGELVSVEHSRLLRRDLDLDLVERIGERDSFNEAIRAMDDIVDEVVKTTWAEMALGHIRQTLADGVDAALIRFALPCVSNKDLPRIRAMTAEHGLLPLLGDDRELVEGTAAIGLAGALLGPTQGLVKGYFMHRGLSYGRVISALDELADTCGVGQVHRPGNWILPSI